MRLDARSSFARRLLGLGAPVAALAACAALVGAGNGRADICAPALGELQIPDALVVRGLAVGNNGFVYAAGVTGLQSIDTATSSVSANLGPGGKFFNRVVANRVTDRVYGFRGSVGTPPNGAVVDGATQSLAATFALPLAPASASFNADAAVDTLHDRVYVSAPPGTNVAVVDGASSSVAATIDLFALTGYAGAFPTGLAVDPVGELLYATVQTSNAPDYAVAVVDVGSFPATLAGTIPLPAAATALAFDETTGLLYAPTSAGLLEIDPATQTITRQAPLISTSSTNDDLQLDPTADRLYLLRTGSVTEVDLADLSETSSVSLPELWSFAVDPDSQRLYAGWSDLTTSPQTAMVSTFGLGCVSTPPDADDDGIADDVDSDGGAGTAPAGFADDTGDGKTTSGTLTSGTVTVDDVADPKGVRITATSDAVLSVCGPPGFDLELPAGAAVTITCGSVVVENVVGPGTVVVRTPNGSVAAAFQEGDAGEVSENGTVAASSGVVTVTVDGVATDVVPGSTMTFRGWDFSGFDAPVDNSTPPATIVLNQVQGGQTVPLKWHLADADGAPVTTLATASVTVQQVACGQSSSTDPLEEVASGPTGLKNQGGGDYQFNWKTQKAWKGTCRIMHLVLGDDAVAHDAYFRFK
jgi:hypothetical protein